MSSLGNAGTFTHKAAVSMGHFVRLSYPSINSYVDMKLSRAKGCPVWGTQVPFTYREAVSMGHFVRLFVHKFVSGHEAMQS